MTEKISAKRWRTTKSQRKRQERKTERNRKYRRVPVSVTNQPRRKRKKWLGSVTMEYKNGPKRGKKFSQPISLNGPARISIRGRDIVIRPRNGKPYVWGEQNPNPEPDSMGYDKQEPSSKRNRAAHKKRVDDLLEAVREKIEDLIDRYGEKDAGRILAKAFLKTYKRLKSDNAKSALSKVYRKALKDYPSVFSSFKENLTSLVR